MSIPCLVARLEFVGTHTISGFVPCTVGTKEQESQARSGFRLDHDMYNLFRTHNKLPQKDNHRVRPASNGLVAVSWLLFQKEFSAHATELTRAPTKIENPMIMPVSTTTAFEHITALSVTHHYLHLGSKQNYLQKEGEY